MLTVGRGVDGDALVELGEPLLHHVRTVVSGGRAPSERRRKSSWCSSRFSATTSCGVMWVTPTSGSTSCGRPAASSADDSCSVWAATTLSSASPWIEQQRPGQLGGQRQQRAGVVDVGLLGRVAEVALGVVRVVQPPLGDRRAGDGGVEHVGPAQHGERGEVAAEAPAADGDPLEVEHGVLLGGAVQRRRPGRRARASRGRGGRPAPTPSPGPACPGRRRRRRRSPGRRTTATARWALCACTTRWPCGPPYGSSSTGSGEPSWSWGSSTAVARRRSPPNDSVTSARTRGVAACDAQLDAVERLPLRARLGERRRPHDDRAAAGGDGVHAGLVGQRLERAVGGPPPHVQRRRVVERVGREHDRPARRRSPRRAPAGRPA